MSNNNKKYTFFQVNQKIVTDLNSKIRRCKITVKSDYVRLVYSKYDVLNIVFYATNDVVALSVAYGCSYLDGLSDFVRAKYITKKDTEAWNSNDWKKYIKKTTNYFLRIIAFSEKLCFVWENYSSFCVDWKPLVSKLLSINGLDEAWWIECEILINEYNINAFAGYPPTYQNVDAYLKSLSILEMAMDKEQKALETFVDEGKEWHSADVGKAMLRSLTAKQKEILQKYIYIGAETGDVD